jgi:putative transposase
MRYQDRQQRPTAYNDPGHAHELTFSCYRKYPFLTERTCPWLSQAIRNACRKLNYALWAYVFMPDHVHLIVWPRDRLYEDSDFLTAVKTPVSRRAVRYLRKEAPEWLEKIRVHRGTKVEHHFWQPGRGHDRNITTSRTLLKMIDYIHQNPVRRGLVELARDWKWSSAGWFEGLMMNDLKPDPIPWDWLEDAPHDV